MQAAIVVMRLTIVLAETQRDLMYVDLLTAILSISQASNHTTAVCTLELINICRHCLLYLICTCYLYMEPMITQ